MITQKRLMERIASWDKHEQQALEEFQLSGAGVYQTRARKYAEYSEIARMALGSYDCLEENGRLSFLLHCYAGSANAILSQLDITSKFWEDPAFQDSIVHLLKSLKEVEA